MDLRDTSTELMFGTIGLALSCIKIFLHLFKKYTVSEKKKSLAMAELTVHNVKVVYICTLYALVCVIIV